MFCDRVGVKIKAGDGGNGAVSFLHEKYKEFGGPDGGDGGKGGDIVLRVSDNLNTLYYFKTHREIRAENGERGKKKKGHGRNGKDLKINVPRGTVVVNEEDGHQVVDMSDIEEFTIARGGEGGFGNAHFTSSVRQTPRVAELGEPGEELVAVFELKMIADVGLVGLPNVGKSTFLSVVSAARPKIADYDFTTLIPNLGVVESGTFGAETGFVAADIPGLIRGASKGKGLGDDFLRHIERTKVIVHFLDATRDDLLSDYQTIRQELENYRTSRDLGIETNLSDLPEVVIINKTDAVSEKELDKKSKKVQKFVKSKIIPISAVAQKNLPNLIHEIEKKIAKSRVKEKKKGNQKTKVFTMKDVVNQDIFEVKKEDSYYIVSGSKIEKLASRTDLSNPHGIARMRDILKKKGIDRELRRVGAKEGEKIKISGKEFVF